jgi:aspartokinase
MGRVPRPRKIDMGDRTGHETSGRPMGAVTKIKVGGIMNSAGLATVSVFSLPDRPDASGAVLHALGAKNINVEFLVHTLDGQGKSHLTLCIDRGHLERALEALEEVKSIIDAGEISRHSNVAVISVFGPHFREKPMISGLMFKALGEAGVTVLAITTSISTCSCIIDAENTEVAMRALHETFEAPHQIAKFAP